MNKLDVIDAILRSRELSAIGKCMAIGIALRSDDELANAYPGASTLALYASLNTRDAVFRHLHELERSGFIVRESRGRGRSNAYRLIPDRVMAAIEAEYHRFKAQKLAPPNGTTASQLAPPDQTSSSQLVPRNGASSNPQLVPPNRTTSQLVPPNRTSHQNELVPPNRTSKGPTSPAAPDTNLDRQTDCLESGSLPLEGGSTRPGVELNGRVYRLTYDDGLTIDVPASWAALAGRQLGKTSEEVHAAALAVCDGWIARRFRGGRDRQRHFMTDLAEALRAASEIARHSTRDPDYIPEPGSPDWHPPPKWTEEQFGPHIVWEE